MALVRVRVVDGSLIEDYEEGGWPLPSDEYVLVSADWVVPAECPVCEGARLLRAFPHIPDDRRTFPCRTCGATGEVESVHYEAGARDG